MKRAALLLAVLCCAGCGVMPVLVPHVNGDMSGLERATIFISETWYAWDFQCEETCRTLGPPLISAAAEEIAESQVLRDGTTIHFLGIESEHGDISGVYARVCRNAGSCKAAGPSRVEYAGFTILKFLFALLFNVRPEEEIWAGWEQITFSGPNHEFK